MRVTIVIRYHRITPTKKLVNFETILYLLVALPIERLLSDILNDKPIQTSRAFQRYSALMFKVGRYFLLFTFTTWIGLAKPYC